MRPSHKEKRNPIYNNSLKVRHHDSWRPAAVIGEILTSEKKNKLPSFWIRINYLKPHQDLNKEEIHSSDAMIKKFEQNTRKVVNEDNIYDQTICSNNKWFTILIAINSCLLANQFAKKFFAVLIAAKCHSMMVMTWPENRSNICGNMDKVINSSCSSALNHPIARVMFCITLSVSSLLVPPSK